MQANRNLLIEDTHYEAYLRRTTREERDGL